MHIAWQPTDSAKEYMVFSVMYTICEGLKVDV